MCIMEIFFDKLINEINSNESLNGKQKEGL